MTDTRRLLPALQTLLADNSSGAISAQDIRDVLISVYPFTYNVLNYGAVGDGVTDDSAAIQSAIDAASANNGGIVFFPPGYTFCCNITLKDQVLLVGQQTVAKKTSTGSKLLAKATGVVIDTPATSIANCGVIGLNVYGLGSGTACKGIRFQNVFRGIISNFAVQEMADEGILINSSSVACWINEGLLQDCVLNRTRSAVTGVLDIDGTDHWIRDIESTASQSNLSDSNLYICAVVLRNANSVLSGVIAEISDIGFYISGNPGVNRFIGCRADLNFAHGFYITGQGNMFSSCLAYRNSRETHNTYSGFYSTSTARHNSFAACNAAGVSGDVGSLAMKYGFEDLVAASSGRSAYVGCRAFNVQTNDYYADGAGANFSTSTTTFI